MSKNDKVMNSNKHKLEYITIELFNLIRKCYNKGSNELKAIIIYQCMDIILQSLEKESDKQQLKNVFDNFRVENIRREKSV